MERLVRRCAQPSTTKQKHLHPLYEFSASRLRSLVSGQEERFALLGLELSGSNFAGQVVADAQGVAVEFVDREEGLAFEEPREGSGLRFVRFELGVFFGIATSSSLLDFNGH